jgi:hypothetical protein
MVGGGRTGDETARGVNLVLSIRIMVRDFERGRWRVACSVSTSAVLFTFIRGILDGSGLVRRISAAWSASL